MVEELDLRGPGPGEVGVKVSACGVCHSDVTYWSGAWGGGVPAVYGHEVAGVVEEVGPGIVGISEGDHVVVTLVRACGRCRLCQKGLPALCEKMGALPLSLDSPLGTLRGEKVVQGLRTAGFAEQVTVHESQVVPIGEHLPLDVACVVGCGVVTGVGAVLNTAEVEPGASVAVIGAGGVGLNVVQGAVVAGASDILVVDVLEAKLAAARNFGATHTADARREEVEAVAARVTAGRGFDHVFVAAGSVPAVEQGLGLVGKGGTVVILGMPAGMRASFDPEAVADGGIRVLGSKVGSVRPQVDVPTLLGLYEQGRLKLDQLVTHRFSLEDVNEAFAAAASGEALRAVVEL